MVESWGARVKHVRLLTGMTQVEFAKKMGVSHQLITKWEAMAHRPYSRHAEWFLRVEELAKDGELPLGPDEVSWREVAEEINGISETG